MQMCSLILYAKCFPFSLTMVYIALSVLICGNTSFLFMTKASLFEYTNVSETKEK